jgi:hypothetical protein
MNHDPECIIEQDKGDRLFLTSMNGKNHFWVSILGDEHWDVEV